MGSKLEERENRRKSFVQSVVSIKEETKEEIKDNEKLVQRSYYLTNRLLKAITIKTAEGELDKSGVVRAALELYLADILREIDSKKNEW